MHPSAKSVNVTRGIFMLPVNCCNFIYKFFIATSDAEMFVLHKYF
jgi:hypothetical protein